MSHTHDHEQDHGHSHDHDHPGGLRGALIHFFVPHSHDANDSIDDALEASGEGIKAVRISLAVLLVTAIVQLLIVWFSGSVALLADTIHNFSDAGTSIPLWIAFALGTRAATKRYTHGFGRIEDLAGLFIVAMIALSAVVAAVESIRRIAEPQPLQHLGWVVAAGVVGFIGNELVAQYRIRTGQRIGSAALVADGFHARTDGFTSLAVVLGAVGVWAGFPLADPIIGLVIAAAILVLLWNTARDVGRRLLDGVDPGLTHEAEHALGHVGGVRGVKDLRLRWAGHRLAVQATLRLDERLSLAEADAVASEAEQALRHALPSVGTVDLVRTGH